MDADESDGAGDPTERMRELFARMFTENYIKSLEATRKTNSARATTDGTGDQRRGHQFHDAGATTRAARPASAGARSGTAGRKKRKIKKKVVLTDDMAVDPMSGRVVPANTVAQRPKPAHRQKADKLINPDRRPTWRPAGENLVRQLLPGEREAEAAKLAGRETGDLLVAKPTEKSFVPVTQTWEAVLAKQEAQLVAKEKQLRQRQEALEGGCKPKHSSQRPGAAGKDTAKTNPWLQQRVAGDVAAHSLAKKSAQVKAKQTELRELEAELRDKELKKRQNEESQQPHVSPTKPRPADWHAEFLGRPQWRPAGEALVPQVTAGRDSEGHAKPD